MAFELVTRKVALPEVLPPAQRQSPHPFRAWFSDEAREDADSFFLPVSYLEGKKASKVGDLRALVSGQFNDWRKTLEAEEAKRFDRIIITRKKGDVMADGEKADEDGIEFFIRIEPKAPAKPAKK
jgi:hypothetical protein